MADGKGLGSSAKLDRRKRKYIMEELVKALVGKRIDVSCGPGSVLRGEVVEVKNGVLYLRDEDEKSAYVSIDKIATVYECAAAVSRPGFIG